MFTSIRLALASIALSVGCAAAMAGTVSVDFVHPETYSDASYSRAFASDKDRAEVQRDIEQHIRRLAQRGLAQADSLGIEVLDIDLAGRFEPFTLRPGADTRILREITWPRIRLRYTLVRGDQVISGAEEQVSDMNYLSTVNRYSGSDRLRYEKAMLDAWFDKRFGNH